MTQTNPTTKSGGSQCVNTENRLITFKLKWSFDMPENQSGGDLHQQIYKKLLVIIPHPESTTMNEAITNMIATPGKYCVSGNKFWENYAVVEVDEHHVVHQLNAKHERDGVLSADGWNKNVEVRPYEEDKQP